MTGHTPRTNMRVLQYYQRERWSNYRRFQSICMYLDESGTEGFEDTFGQRGLCAVSEGAGQKQ